MVNGSAFPSTLASTGPVMRILHSTVVAERDSNVKLVCNGNNVQQLDTTLKWTFNTHKMTHNGYRNIKIVWRPERQAFYSLNSPHTEYINVHHSGFWLLNSSPQMPVSSQRCIHSVVQSLQWEAPMLHWFAKDLMYIHSIPILCGSLTTRQ